MYTCIMTGRRVDNCDRCRHKLLCAGVDLYHADTVGRWLAVDRGHVYVGKSKAEAMGKVMYHRIVGA